MSARPTAFVVPASTFARELQRCRKASHAPTAAQQPGPIISRTQGLIDRANRQRMTKVAI